MKLLHRIWLPTAITMVLCTAALAIGAWTWARVDHSLHEMSADIQPDLEILARLQTRFEGLTDLVQSEPATVAHAASAELAGRVSGMRALLEQPGVSVKTGAALSSLRLQLAQVQAQADQLVAATSTGQPWAQAITQLRLLELLELLGQEIATESVRAQQLAQGRLLGLASALRLLMSTLGLGALLLVIGLALVAAGTQRHLARELGGEPSDLTGLLKELNEGNVSRQIEVADSLKRSAMGALVQLRDALRRVSANVRLRADMASDMVASIAAGQQDAVNRTITARQIVRSAAVGADELAQLTHGAAQAAAELPAVATRIDRAARQADAAMAEARTAAATLHSIAQRISDVSQGIEEVTVQAEFIALNAAAGSGRGVGADARRSTVAEHAGALARDARRAAESLRRLVDDSAGAVRVGQGRLLAANEAAGVVLKSVHGLVASASVVDSVLRRQEAGAASLQEDVRRLNLLYTQPSEVLGASFAAVLALQDQIRQLRADMHPFALDARDTSLTQAAALHDGAGTHG